MHRGERKYVSRFRFHQMTAPAPINAVTTTMAGSQNGVDPTAAGSSEGHHQPPASNRAEPGHEEPAPARGSPARAPPSDQGERRQRRQDVVG